MFSFEEEETCGFSCLRDSRPILPYVGASLIPEGSIRSSSTGLGTPKALEDIFSVDAVFSIKFWYAIDSF